MIVAAAVTQQANDSQQLVPMLEQMRENCGELPRQATADAGYFNTKQLSDQRLSAVDLYVAPDRHKHGQAVAECGAHADPQSSLIEQMRQKIRSAEGHAVYRFRKAIVKPVFGTIKAARGFRRFSLRGLAKVAAE